jgi:hypothetical protein
MVNISNFKIKCVLKMNYEEMVRFFAGKASQDEREQYLKTLKKEYLDYFKHSTNLPGDYIKEAWILARIRYPNTKITTKFRICKDILWRNYPM